MVAATEGAGIDAEVRVCGEGVEGLPVTEQPRVIGVVFEPHLYILS